MSEVLTAQQIESLRKALDDKKVASRVAESRVVEIEKQIQEEFGISVDKIPQKLAELQQEVDDARVKLQEEYAEFNELWSAITSPAQTSPAQSFTF
jgi:uncharacterized coiled-coil DUF342 family protein